MRRPTTHFSALLLWLAPAVGLPAAHAQPSIEFEMGIQQLGVVYDSDGPQDIVYPFTNGGDEVLKISRIESTCSCLTGGVADATYEYAPGESGEIRLELDPTKRKGQGRVWVNVETNDPNRAEYPLYVEAHVKTRLYAPSMPRLYQLNRGEGGSMEFQLSGPEADFKVLSARVVDQPAFRVKILSHGSPVQTRDDDTYFASTMRFTADGSLPIGHTTGTLLLETNDPFLPTREMPMRVKVLSDARLTPTALRLEGTRAGGPAELEFTVSSHGGTPFRITSFRHQGDGLKGLKVQVAPLNQERTRYRVAVSGTVPQNPTGGRGRFVFKTDLPGETEHVNTISYTSK